jgi:hypothetical protein
MNSTQLNHQLEYLGRSITVMPPQLSRFINQLKWLQEAAVLFIVPESFSSSQIQEMLMEIVSREPIAIMITGKESEMWFEQILKVLSQQHTLKHTMTYHAECKIEEAIEEFLHNALPSEERFEEWKRYVIITDKTQEVYAFFDAEKMNADENR